MRRILLIDDSSLHRKVMRDALANEGFVVEEAADGPSGLRLLYERHPDAVILDVLMPAMDGWTVCRRIRELSETPIIMLTSLDREEEMIKGLNLGADDFLAKPISPAHLVARVQALLRRSPLPLALSDSFHYDDGCLEIDAADHRVSVSGSEVSLTPTEFRLLTLLARRPGVVQTYAALLDAIWGPEYIDDLDFLRVYVWRLRKKLEAGHDQRWIENERAIGYRFRRVHTRP